MNKTLFTRIAMVCVGIVIISFAVSLSLYSDMGTDPCTCLNWGISRSFGLSFGVCQLIMNSIVLIFTIFFDRHLIGFGTIVNMTAIGFFVDFFYGIMKSILPGNPPFPLRILCMLCGIVILSFAAALYMYPKLGVSPYDSIGFMLTEYTHIQFRWCRIAYDTLSVLIGWFLGSTVGVGTVITALCIGPLIKFFSGLIEKRFRFLFDPCVS